MNWPVVTLSDVADVHSGDPAPQGNGNFAEHGTPFIRAGSLVLLLDGGTETALEQIPKSISSNLRMKTYPARTVVFAKSGMSCTKGLIYQTSSDAHIVSHLAAIVCGKQLLPEFLRRWYEVNSPTRHIENAAYPSIKISTIRSEQIPLPPLAEQRRIAKILDAADILRARRREALAQLDTLLKATFLDLFGDPVTNPKGWKVMTIAESPLHLGDGNYSSKYPKASDFVADGVPFIRANNILRYSVTDRDMRFISKTQHAELRKGHLRVGDVLITTRGDNGQVAIVPKRFADANINAQLVLLRPTDNTIRSAFLCYLLANPSMQKKIKSLETGVALKQLPIRSLKQLPLIVPSSNLQDRFGKVAESIERQKALQLAHLAEMDILFASLQSRAFKGEL